MNRLSRRHLLQASLVSGATLAASAWLPRLARASASPSIKRVVIINAKGGPRWNALFDGQTDVLTNPWGVAPSSIFGAAPVPKWGFSRMLLQKPLPMATSDWAGTVYPYIHGANNFNTASPTLTTWGGKPLASLAQIAQDISVVRCTGNPGGVFDTDHGSAVHTLSTGYRSGQVGLVTAFHKMLRDQLDSAYDASYALPAVQIGAGAFGLGVGAYAAARPMTLSYSSLPTVDPGNSVATWGRNAESDIENALMDSRQAYMAQAVADFISDKTNGDAHVTKLIDPALHLTLAANASASLGTLIDKTTPVTNAMLTELFGLTSATTPAGDMLFDSFGAQHDTSSPSWTYNQNDYGQMAALALRFLQKGAPVIAVNTGFFFDTHSNEVLDPQGNLSHPVQAFKLVRMLTGLAFALKNVADPLDPTHSLWDSTVVMVCSEFGRTVSGANGFNSPNGSNGGGSDHGPWSAWPLLGGPVTGAGELYVASDNGGFYHQNRVFTTLMKGMGLEPSDPSAAYLPYDVFPPISGVVAGVS